VDRYLSLRVIFLSLFEGFIAFLISLIFLSFKTSLTISLIIALALLIINPLCLYISDKKYDEIEFYIDDKIILKANVYFNFYGRLRSGYFYLTENIIYLHSRDRKPYLMAHIYKEEITQVDIINNRSLNIYIEGNYIYEIKSPNCGKIVSAMIQSGWIGVINL